MAEVRWITMLLFMTLTLLFTATAPHTFVYVSVKDGDDVTLSCENEIGDRDKCGITNWLFTDSSQTPFIKLVNSGQIEKSEISISKSDRLRVTETCSLVIKRVTVQDVGQYTCRQQGRDSASELSVVSMTDVRNTDQVTLRCSVSAFGDCRHTVKWLFQGREIDKNNNQLVTSQSPCSTSVSFLKPHFSHSRNTLFKCEVIRPDGSKQQFSFRSPSSGEDTKTTTTTTTTKSTRAMTASVITTMSVEDPTVSDWQLGIIVVAAILAAFIITVVVLKGKKMKKGNKRQVNENTAGPEDALSYASVSFTTKTNSRAQVHNKGEDGAVTYSTVKASSSSAGASADPSSLYATINKPKQ